MKRSTLLLVLASVIPSYFALFQDSGMAIGIVILSTFIGFIATCTLADEIGESLPIRQMIRLGVDMPHCRRDVGVRCTSVSLKTHPTDSVVTFDGKWGLNQTQKPCPK